MKITSFSPLIMTNDSANVQKVFEELGFVKQHEKKDVAETNNSGGFRMKDAEGHGVSIAQVNQIPRDMLAVQMNVSDFDEPLELFCDILDGEKIPYTVSQRFVRNLPKIELPQA